MTEGKEPKSAQEKYGDIIDHEHHTSSKHPRMSRLNRAAQFAPFAALVGYDALVNESARITDNKIELSEDDVTTLNYQLRLLQENLPRSPIVSVTYFVPDSFKSGGEYKEIVERVLKIKPLEQILIMEDGTQIAFSDILALRSKLFIRLEDDIQFTND